MDKQATNEKDKTYGRWFVLESAPKPTHLKTDGAYWLCECQCPAKTRKVIRGATLREGLSLSCGCYKEEQVKKIRKPDAPFNSIMYRYRKGADKRGLPFELTMNDIRHIVVQDCHYCGAKPAQTFDFLRKHDFVYNGIDRMDNALGYVPGNCVPCCVRCNYAKLDSGYEEFREWISQAYHHLHTV